MGKVGFITMEKQENRPDNTVGSSRIRAKWVAKYWDEAEEYRVGGHYDTLIFQKAYWLTMLKVFEGIKIFDLCDPDWMDPRPVVEVMEYCDAMVTSSPALAEFVQKFVKTKPVICIPDRVDLAEHTPRGKHEGQAKKAVWFGYSSNIQYVEQTFDLLIEKGLELVIVSNNPYIPQGIYKDLKITNVKYDYESVHDAIKECDMAILPTSNSYRAKFKSNNKSLTCYALGVPVAQSADDVDRFMEADARNREMQQKLIEVKEKWDVKISVAEWKALIKDIEQKRQGSKKLNEEGSAIGER